MLQLRAGRLEAKLEAAPDEQRQGVRVPKEPLLLQLLLPLPKSAVERLLQHLTVLLTELRLGRWKQVLRLWRVRQRLLFLLPLVNRQGRWLPRQRQRVRREGWRRRHHQLPALLVQRLLLRTLLVLMLLQQHLLPLLQLLPLPFQQLLLPPPLLTLSPLVGRLPLEVDPEAVLAACLRLARAWYSQMPPLALHRSHFGTAAPLILLGLLSEATPLVLLLLGTALL
mmetsp:Transcript_93756/g.248909  ORF Transcript_93756/g.248909 Transcript_93756/m.248909 type:complete len:225 (+) Transcript_93756:492-1166(+)